MSNFWLDIIGTRSMVPSQINNKFNKSVMIEPLDAAGLAAAVLQYSLPLLLGDSPY